MLPSILGPVNLIFPFCVKVDYKVSLREEARPTSPFHVCFFFPLFYFAGNKLTPSSVITVQSCGAGELATWRAVLR